MFLKCCHALSNLRSFRTASVAASVGLQRVEGAELAVETPRPAEAVLKTAVEKIKSLSLNLEAAVETHPSTPLLKQISDLILKGALSVEELTEAAQKGHMTQRDLRSLVQLHAVQPSTERHIRALLHGGMPLLSMTEVMELMKNRLLGKADLIQILKNGDLTIAELEYLTQKQLLPRDVLEVVKEEAAAQTNIQHYRFSKIQSMLASEQIPRMQLTTFILKGDLHPDDLSLFVAENLLSEKEADAIVESCASEVTEVYEEAEKLAELVGNGRFTFEELEVMRAKGVFGDALVHYLTLRNAIEEDMAQKLLLIEPDANYIDPEFTDDEREAPPPKGVSKEGSHEGFYPEGVARDDVFALWEHLSEVYAERPGVEESYDLSQDSGPSIGLKRLPKADSVSSVVKPAKMDAAGNVLTVGKRKTSVAQIKLRSGTGSIIINNQSFYDYFPSMDARCYVLSPFLTTDTLGQFDAEVTVEGGGWSGQAQAVRHGLARALLHFTPDQETALKELGLIKRDPRMVERKKPGRAKARKSFQWVKR